MLGNSFKKKGGAFATAEYGLLWFVIFKIEDNFLTEKKQGQSSHSSIIHL